MEAVRPAQIATPVAAADIPDTRDNALPPPPAPFPVELLPSTAAVNQESRPVARNEPAVSPQNVQSSATAHVDLADVQRSCVHALTLLLPESVTDGTRTASLSDADKQLASALSELLEVSYELESLRPSPVVAAAAPPTGSNLQASYAALVGHLSELCDAAQRRPAPRAADAGALHPAISVVREELAWARVEALGRAVIELVRRARVQGDAQSVRSLDLLGADQPPTYTRDDWAHAGADGAPPGYDDAPHAESAAAPAEKPRASLDSLPPHGEKMMRELDTVVSAIERLHHAAPQLNDQRSELRPVAGPSTRRAGDGGTQRMLREREKMRELEEIWDKIERAHGRRRNRDDEGQRVDGDALSERRTMKRNEFLQELVDRAEAGRLQAQDSVMGERRSVDVDLARARELRDRDEFLQELVEQSAGSRLVNQDARLDASARSLGDKRQAFLADLMTKTRAGRLNGQDFPASIEDRLAERRGKFYEAIADYSSSGRLHHQDSAPPTPKASTSRVEADPFELVTVQDFLSSPAMASTGSGDGKAPDGARAGARMEKVASGDSGGSGTRSRSNSAGAFRKIAGMVRRGSLGLGLKGVGVVDANTVSYIAEHQENLRAVQVLVYGVGLVSNPDLVIETTGETSGAITSKKDATLSIPLALPTAVTAGQAVPLTAADMCLEAKLAAVALPPAPPQLNSAITHALSAPELRTLLPRAICCTSCDREVADVGAASADPATGFKDLPSEHWAEMMEVWMCHQDAGFTKRLAERTRDGFWPARGQVLVGGSYLLVEESAVKRANLGVNESVQVSRRLPPCRSTFRARRRPTPFIHWWLCVSFPARRRVTGARSSRKFRALFADQVSRARAAEQETRSLLVDTRALHPHWPSRAPHVPRRPRKQSPVPCRSMGRGLLPGPHFPERFTRRRSRPGGRVAGRPLLVRRGHWQAAPRRRQARRWHAPVVEMGHCDAVRRRRRRARRARPVPALGLSRLGHARALAGARVVPLPHRRRRHGRALRRALAVQPERARRVPPPSRTRQPGAVAAAR